MPLPILFGTFFALIFLTIVTVAQSYLNLGYLELYVAMAIATVKAALVLLFFMHLIHDKKFNILVILSSVIFVAVFLSFATMDSRSYAPDVAARQVENPPRVLRVVAEPAAATEAAPAATSGGH